MNSLYIEDFEKLDYKMCETIDELYKPDIDIDITPNL